MSDFQPASEQEPTGPSAIALLRPIVLHSLWRFRWVLALGFVGPERSLPEQLGCELDARGNIVAGENKQTTVPGVFTAGDCTRGQSLVVWAIAEGRAAARGVDDYLQGEFVGGAWHIFIDV